MNILIILLTDAINWSGLIKGLSAIVLVLAIVMAIMSPIKHNKSSSSSSSDDIWPGDWTDGSDGNGD